MSERFSGGIISKTPVTPSGPYETDSASGIWTLDQQMQYAKQNIWPTAGRTVPDAQFNYVTMLLHGDGTNGAQNNTFLDSSTNNFTITRNGNTTQGSFSPYGSNWSNYFDGTEDYLSYTQQTYSSDFTFECWVYQAESSGNYPIFFASNTASLQIMTDYQGTGKLTFYYNGSQIQSASGVFQRNQWNHLAYVRSGSTLTIYYNGTSVASGTQSDAIPVSYLGGYSSSGYTLNGYMSNVRITTSAVYTTAFTPPTAPLTAISGTSLLTCQSNRFIDNSTNAFAITVTGNPSVQRFNPFGASTAYSTSVIGGSGYFSDSSGTQMLYLPSNTAFNLDANFTIEGWVYKFGTTSKIFLGSDYNNGNSPTINNQIQFDRSGTAGLTGMYHPSTGWLTVTCSSSPNSAWFHLAYVRSGSTVTIYLNGVSQGTISTSETYQFSGGAVGGLRNYSETSGGGWYGYMSNFRIVKGTAVYTSNFTPPTAPLISVSGTSVLLSMTNGAIFDNAMMNDLETVGNAQISTSVVKYGTGSMYFDGTGDWLSILNTPTSTVWGTESWTIEGWIYPTAVDSTYRTLYVNGYPIQIYQKGGSVEIYISSTNGFSYIVNGLTGPTFSVAANTWTHFAVVKNGNDYKVYVNGIGGSTVTSSTAIAYTSATNAFIGDASIFGSYPFAGYIDDFRITKGYARYTANFTPPTAAFPNIGPT